MAKFLRLTGAAGSKEAVVSLAASIVEEHLEKERYPELEDYAEAIRDFSSDQDENLEGKLDEDLKHQLAEQADKWLVMAAEILAVKVAGFCRDEGLIAVEEGDRE
ncbi:hypothetical protein AKJ39_01835 [candidate division MSBL1 archaeon SCGC-AAA259J03]|uniref:Uncharacterized protein n=1 Tax=candidate division MSBL1 archaeon SCGC-AAA259J03 TaxID=1698269 RepID=A0A656YWI0_9EURY|nr:hypothetical protein AKJ39_01835 [candidate division MSBL1 archaeon SCGC-AAA259J03]